MARSVIGSLGVLLLLFAAPSQAQFYKWTDEQGNVHYSQKPPPGQKAKSLDIQVRQPEPGATTPRSAAAGTSLRCGSIRVPTPRRDAASSVAMYREAIGVWQKYITENQAKDDAALQLGIEDRRCAIAEANKALEGLSEAAQNLDTMHQELALELQEMEAQLAECDNPNREPEGRTANGCKQHYSARIKQLKKQQRQMMPTGTAAGEFPQN